MSGGRGRRILLAALLLLLSIPVLTGCMEKRTSAAKDEPEGSWEKNTVPEPEEIAPEEAPMKTPHAEPTVRVAIKLSAPSVTQAGYRLGSVAKNPDAKAYQEQLQEEQEKMIRRIEEQLGHPIEVKQRMTLTTNVISANVYPSDLDTLRAMDGVVSVTEETRHEPTAGVPTVPGNTASG